MGYLQVATKTAESRLEKLIQPGRETQRHLVATIAELDTQKCDGRLKWLCRQVVVAHSTWFAAGKRKGEDWGRGTP